MLRHGVNENTLILSRIHRNLETIIPRFNTFSCQFFFFFFCLHFSASPTTFSLPFLLLFQLLHYINLVENALSLCVRSVVNRSQN